MNEIEQLLKVSKNEEKFEQLLANTRESAQIAEMEYEDGGMFRLSIMDEVNKIAEAGVEYRTAAGGLFNKIATDLELLPEMTDGLAKADRELMLEFLSLIETNTRSFLNNENSNLMVEFLNLIETNTRSFLNNENSNLMVGFLNLIETNTRALSDRSDNEMMLEFLSLIETNTRGFSVTQEGELVTANQMSLIMDSVARSLDDSLAQQTILLNKLVTNSDYERALLESEEDEISEDILPEAEEPMEQPKVGIADMFSNVLKGGKGLLGGLLGGLGKVGRIAGKGFLLASAAMFVKDLYDTFSNEEEIRKISGNAEGVITAAQKTTATIAGAIEKTTFGLIDAKDTYALLIPAVKGIVRVLSDIGDAFIFIKDSAVKAYDTLMEKGPLAAIEETVTSIREGIIGFLDRVSGYFTDLFNFNPKLGEFGAKYMDRLGDLIGSTTDAIGDSIGSLFDQTESEASLKAVPESIREAMDEEPMYLASKAVNRSPSPEEGIKMSKERMEAREQVNQVATPQPNIINNVNNTTYNPMQQENSLVKQLQILGI